MKTLTPLPLTLVIVTILFGFGCGQSAQQEAEETARKLNEAGEKLAAASEELNQSLEDRGEGLADAIENVQKAVGVDAAVEVVGFRKLKEALPSELEGFTAGKPIGEKTKVMGIGSSKAQVRFTGNEAASILVRITDTGSIAGWAALAGKAAGVLSEVDRETETGFERSAIIDGIHTTESHDSASGISTIRLFYGNRYVIELDGKNVTWEQMEAARDAIGMKRLDELKEESLRAAK